MIGATYRLQFREGVGFDEAAVLARQLAAAGITHLYASPIFSATEGSTHGYDVTDHNALDPVLGGRKAFERLSAALKAHGLGLLLDIVPNHMAASPQNGWWRDVLTNGRQSPYADHFDIDWQAPKLILPVLGMAYGTALQNGEIVRGEHPEWGPVLLAHGNPFPIRPGTETIEDVDGCHEAQHYRLAHWRLGRDGLTYRRFFEITGLVGVRVEDDGVFEDVHRLTKELVEAGMVDGLRVDHVDGLTDPAGYLATLAERLSVPIVVEKILEADERLPSWPVLGTTGYEMIAAFASLYAQDEGLAHLSRSYGAIAQDDVDALTAEAKHEILTRNLAGELERLTGLLLEIFAGDRVARDHGRATVREGLTALMTAMPVYRTYVTDRADGADVSVLEEAAEAAREVPLDDPAIIADIVARLTAPGRSEVEREFVQRFQQVSGPLMAKAVEDTLFFRHHRFLGANEVGGAADLVTGDAPILRVLGETGLAATQTHDTKRGEDARARLYALTDPDAASRFDTLWPQMPGDIPDRLRWALTQMLFASAPLAPDPDFADRLREAALKTVREAKEDTSWTRQNAAFEDRVAQAAVDMAGALDRLAPLEPVHRAGAVIGLGQALLKGFGRRAPDIYQGTFGWDFSMVDPDNRRPVDFAAEAALIEEARSSSLDALKAGWTGGAVKARVLLEALALRRERPQLFANGTVQRIDTAEAPGIAAFSITHGADMAVAAVPTMPLRALASDLTIDRPLVPLGVDKPLYKRFADGAEIGEAADSAVDFRRFPVFLATSWAPHPAA